MQKVYVFLGILLLTSCTIDYNIGKSFVNEQERIIVNGYLNPSEFVRVHLHKLQKKNNNYVATGLTGYRIIFKENETILYEGIYQDSIFEIDYLPRTGNRYSIEVAYPDLQTAKAKTLIPKRNFN